jgi:hypothetical protein
MLFLKEINRSFLIVEHDPIFLRRCQADGRIRRLCPQADLREATILLHAPALDPHLQTITELSDRMFCIYEKEKTQLKGRAKMPGARIYRQRCSTYGPGEVEEMTQRRLEERIWLSEMDIMLNENGEIMAMNFLNEKLG